MRSIFVVLFCHLIPFAISFPTSSDLTAQLSYAGPFSGLVPTKVQRLWKLSLQPHNNNVCSCCLQDSCPAVCAARASTPHSSQNRRLLEFYGSICELL